jgi:hypothetical protein
MRNYLRCLVYIMRKASWIILALLLLGMMGTPYACADEVIYTFVAADSSFPGGLLAFQLAVPDFINPPAEIYPILGTEDFPTCTQLVSSTNCGKGVAFWISSGSDPDQLDFYANNSIIYGFGFLPGSFSTPGTQTCCAGVASLTVASEVVPEPSLLILLLTGFALETLTLRKFRQGGSNSSDKLP